MKPLMGTLMDTSNGTGAVPTAPVPLQVPIRGSFSFLESPFLIHFSLCDLCVPCGLLPFFGSQILRLTCGEFLDGRRCFF